MRAMVPLRAQPMYKLPSGPIVAASIVTGVAPLRGSCTTGHPPAALRVACEKVVHADDAVRRARNVCRVDSVRGGVKSGLHRRKCAGINRAHACGDDVVKPADAWRSNWIIRIVDLGI